MQAEQRILSKFIYSQAEWVPVKIITGIYWLLVMARVVLFNNYYGQPFPEGISRLYDFSILIQKPYAYIILCIAAVLVLLYIMERYMIPVLLSISIISMAILSVERSHGVSSRDELCSLVFIAQAIAYIRYALANQEFRAVNKVYSIAIFYTIQVIAAAYTISAISKLQAAGIHWVTQSPNIVLALYKLKGQIAIEFGWPRAIAHIDSVINFITAHPLVTRILFSGAICIELFSFTAMLSRKHARCYGWLLIMLHIGIATVTIIFIPTFIIFVAVYMIGIPTKAITALRQLAKSQSNSSI